MSWENVIKVERDQQFPQLLNIGERLPPPIPSVTVGKEPTDDDFRVMGIAESEYEKLQDSFFKDLQTLVPEDAFLQRSTEDTDKILNVFVKILNLKLLTYTKIKPNKKIEYLTDLKNKIVNDLYLEFPSAVPAGKTSVPYPGGELLILRERPIIQETLYVPDPRDPEGLATVPDQQAAIISDRFADEAEEFRNDAVSKISRIIKPFFEDVSIKPVEDDSVPRQEPQAVTGGKPFNFKNVHGDLSRMFGNSIKIDNVGNPVITSLAIKKFEEIIQKEMARVTGEDSKTPSISKLPSNITGKFRNVNRSDKVKFSSVDYFFTKLAQEKQNKTQIDKLFREDVVGLDMSTYRVLVKLYLVNYKNTAVSNLPAILGKKSKEPQKEKEPVTFTIEFAGQQFDPTKPEDIKAIQELASSPTGKEEDERIRQERANQIRENINTVNEIIEEINEPVSEAQSLQNLISELSNNNLISFTDDDKIDINSNEALERLQRLQELNITLKPEFGEQEQEMASRVRGTKLPKRARITEPTARIEPKVLSREQEKQMQQDIKDEANPKTKKKLIEELRLRQRQNRMYEMLRLSGVKFDETRKALDNLLIQLGVTTDTIVKEDTGVILNELNKKDKRLVKTLLQLAHPTEYFNEDVLKLGELITVLKSLGVVNENKGLKKRILKYEDENLMVVKRAVKLRREYEKLYKSIREVIYPKTGDDNE
jgi:hypothetical protein